jgi:hypothetical protein
MAVSAKLYGLFFKSLCNKEIDLDTDTIKFMMTTSSYTPDQDTHQYKSSVTNEVTGTGWAAGGVTVGSVAVTYDTATNVLKIDAADISESGVTVANARYGVLYDSSPASDATRPLIAYVDFDGNQSATAGSVAITWNASGIATVTIA